MDAAHLEKLRARLLAHGEPGLAELEEYPEAAKTLLFLGLMPEELFDIRRWALYVLHGFRSPPPGWEALKAMMDCPDHDLAVMASLTLDAWRLDRR